MPGGALVRPMKASEKIAPEETTVIVLSRIIAATSQVTGVWYRDILGRKRNHEITRARHIAMWLALQLLKTNYCEIGRAFGRDHSTVLVACKSIAWKSKHPGPVKRIIDEIVFVLEQRQAKLIDRKR